MDLLKSVSQVAHFRHPLRNIEPYITKRECTQGVVGAELAEHNILRLAYPVDRDAGVSQAQGAAAGAGHDLGSGKPVMIPVRKRKTEL